MIRVCKEELIETYDGLVPQDLQSMAFELMRKTGFTCTERDFPEADPRMNMLSANLDMEEQGVIHKLAMAISSHIVNNEDYYLDRVYANCYTPTDAPQVHQDVKYGNGLTILYYANDIWSPGFGGETVFFKDDEIFYSVLPKPGRFVVFDSRLLHCARVQNILGPKFRYTIVFKLLLK